MRKVMIKKERDYIRGIILDKCEEELRWRFPDDDMSRNMYITDIKVNWKKSHPCKINIDRICISKLSDITFSNLWKYKVLPNDEPIFSNKGWNYLPVNNLLDMVYPLDLIEGRSIRRERRFITKGQLIQEHKTKNVRDYSLGNINSISGEAIDYIEGRTDYLWVQETVIDWNDKADYNLMDYVCTTTLKIVDNSGRSYWTNITLDVILDLAQELRQYKINQLI